MSIYISALEGVSTTRFQRVHVSLHGRYMLQPKHEYPCQTLEMSPGEAFLLAPINANLGERVVLYLQDLGRFTGIALRLAPAGFEMSLDLSLAKRDKLADRLTWFANRYIIDMGEQRRHERIVPFTDRTVLRLERAPEYIVKILSLSQSGVSIESDIQPAIGTNIILGRTPAVVVRHLDQGVACEFLRQFKIGEIDETTRL